MFLDLTFELGIPGEAALVFSMLVPGYSVIENFSPNIPALEKVAVSIGISLALFLGLRGLVEASRMWILSCLLYTSDAADE